MDVTEIAPFSRVNCPRCATEVRVKTEFGPYKLLRRHAIGGMSVVFIAHDSTLNREVVVKILNEEYGGNEKRITAFEEEARITACFSHPHVVRVFTTGRAFGRFYIAMELVGGGHFEHHIKERGSIPEDEVLPLAIQVAEGLKAAQSAGLIHRDVKPANILLDASGNAKIVDFGLALVTKGGSVQATEIWATPYYVPPETIEGLPEDFRSDIYAFGASFYHALAGKPPCDEESMDTNKLRDAKQKVVPLTLAAPLISQETAATIDRAMAYQPGDRFSSYDELLAALKGARQRLANGAPAAPSRRDRRAPRERLMLIGAGALFALAVAFALWSITRSTTPKQTVVEIPVAPIQSGDGNTGAVLVGSRYREAGQALAAGDYRKASDLYAGVRDDPGVLEPTGSWAACEAVISCYLDGRSGDARDMAAKGLQHIAGTSGLDAAYRDILTSALAHAGDLPPAATPDVDAIPTGATLVASLVSGLKNWEQGAFSRAVPHFRLVLRADAKGPDAWVTPYQQLLSGYLEDFDTLSKAEPKAWPENAEDCKALVNEYHRVHDQLKTKGRAPFNVRVWQLELEKRAQELVVH
jgi:tRNA A-37 threonylcarbamoyl transferase component Bud32